jgi:hypothetical protein
MSDPLNIEMQTKPPADFVCYECKDGNHERCVGVPCFCKCEYPKILDLPIDPFLRPFNGPVVAGLEDFEVVYAKDQPEYLPLRTLVSDTKELNVMSRWTLTPEQRAAIAAGADIFLELMTWGHPLQPIKMRVVQASDDAPSVAASLGLVMSEAKEFRKAKDGE